MDVIIHKGAGKFEFLRQEHFPHIHYQHTHHCISSVQSLSRVRLFATPWTAARQASLSINNSQNLLKLMSIESMMPSNHLILCHPLLLLPPIPPSIRVFSNESALHMRWPKYWSLSFNISPSNEHPGLISFRMDWLDLLAVQGTLKSLLQHHSSKASVLLCSAFLTVQPSHPYMTTGEATVLMRQPFVGRRNRRDLEACDWPGCQGLPLPENLSLDMARGCRGEAAILVIDTPTCQ